MMVYNTEEKRAALMPLRIKGEKTMKKICAVLLSIVLMLSCLPLAFAGQGVEGKWKLSRETLLAALGAADASEYASMVDSILYTMDFRTDGTMIMIVSMFGTEQSYTDEWHYTGDNSIYLTMQGAPFDMTFYFENGNLVLNDGIAPMVLEPVEGTSAAASVPAAPTSSAQGVEGKWKISTETLERAFSTDAEMDGLANLMTFTMEFIDDGTMIMTVSIMGVDSVSNEVWHYTGDNSLYMTMESVGYNMTFRFENNNLILNDGLNDTVLEPFDDNAVPAPVSPAFTDDLSGQWDGRGLYNYMLVVAAAVGQDFTSMQSLFDMMNFTLNLNADGTATLDVEAFGTSDTENLNTWSVSGDKFTVSGISFTFTLSGDTLTLTPDMMGEPFTMTRIK